MTNKSRRKRKKMMNFYMGDDTVKTVVGGAIAISLINSLKK
jgi:hypothetical protein